MTWAQCMSGLVLMTSALVVGLTAQQISEAPQSSEHHVRYKVIDTGALGGPNAHMSLGAHILNNSGMFTGHADTAEPDPYAPDGCWDGDCLVAHVVRWKNGRLIDLGVLDSGPNSESNWISENGFIAGDSQNGQLDPLAGGAWEIRGVLWRRGQIYEMGTLGGGNNSLARAVNSAGEVVGLSTTTVPDPYGMILDFGLPYAYQTRAYRWKDGIIQDLGTLGGADAMALGINERGQIIGNSYTDDHSSPVCGLTTGAFLWQNGTMTNLGSLGGTCTQVSAINNRGQVAGSSSLSGDGAFHPFLWERGRMRDLGKGGGNFGSPITLTENGDASGWQSLAGNDNLIHATLWTHGHAIDLGSLGPDQCSIAWGMNSSQQVVGLSGDCDFKDPSLRAFLWEPGNRMVDLNTLISPSLGIQLRNVATINDRGEMAVVGFFADGTHRPVLLVPCDGEREECRDVIAAANSVVPLGAGQPRTRNHDANRIVLPEALSRWRKRVVQPTGEVRREQQP